MFYLRKVHGYYHRYAHTHLLGGVGTGPQTWEDWLEMFLSNLNYLTIAFLYSRHGRAQEEREGHRPIQHTWKTNFAAGTLSLCIFQISWAMLRLCMIPRAMDMSVSLRCSMMSYLAFSVRYWIAFDTWEGKCDLWRWQVQGGKKYRPYTDLRMQIERLFMI